MRGADRADARDGAESGRDTVRGGPARTARPGSARGPAPAPTTAPTAGRRAARRARRPSAGPGRRPAPRPPRRPRARSRAPSRPPSRRGPTVTRSGRGPAADPCSAAKAHTASSASATGRPGSPTASAAFARPVKPPAARSRHAPSGRSTGAGHASAQRCSRRATAAHDARRGIGGGIARTATTASHATGTGPRRVCTTRVPSPSSPSSPTASVSRPPRTRWRSATRRPRRSRSSVLSRSSPSVSTWCIVPDKGRHHTAPTARHAAARVILGSVMRKPEWRTRP